MTRPIIIALTTCNRQDLTAITLDNLKRCRSSLSDVLILDDASTDYGQDWLKRWGFEVVRSASRLGVGEAARWRLHAATDAPNPYMLLLDNDLVFAPGFDMASLEAYCSLQHEGTTVFSPYHSNTQEAIGEELSGTCLRVKTINGCAQFMSKETGYQVLNDMSGKWQHPWDANISKVLAKMVVPRRSLVQHLGIHGTGVNGFSTDQAVDFLGTPM